MATDFSAQNFPAPRSVRRSSLALQIVVGMVWLTILTQKFTVGANIQITLPIMLAGLLSLLLLRAAKIVLWRAVFISLFLAYTLTAHSFGAHTASFSVPSLYLFAVMMLLFSVQIEWQGDEHERVLLHFQAAAAAIAGIVILQWVAQFAGQRPPDMHDFISQDYMFQRYVYIQPLYWGSPWIKPNGFFMLEASFTSQLLAMALVVETVYFRRFVFMGLFSFTLLASFGATGMLMAALTAPFLLRYLSGRMLVTAIVLGAGLIAFGLSFGVFDNLTARTNEFSVDASSGSGRFIVPYEFMQEVLGRSWESFMFGIGAGTARDQWFLPLQTVFPHFARMTIEHGFAVGLLSTIYVVMSMIYSRAALPLVVVCFLQFNFMNGALVPIATAYCILLCSLHGPPGGRLREASEEDMK